VLDWHSDKLLARSDFFVACSAAVSVAANVGQAALQAPAVVGASSSS
jgi:hypothetical protein